MCGLQCGLGGPWPWMLLAQVLSYQGGPTFTGHPRVCSWRAQSNYRPRSPFHGILPAMDEADSECEAAECTGALVVSCVGHIATAQWAVPLHSVFLLSFTIRRPEEILNHQQLMWASVVNTQPLTSLLVQNFLLINHCSFPHVIKILSVNCGGVGPGPGVSSPCASSCVIFTVTP